MQLQEKIRTEGRRNPWKIGTLNQTPFGDPLSEAKKVWADLEKSRTAPSPAISDADSGNIATDRPKPIKRPATEQFPEVARNPLSASRLDNETIFACILENFPETTLTRQSEHTVEQVRALGPEYLLDLTVPLHRYVEMVAFLKNSALLDMNFLLHVTAVDRLDRFEVLAHLLSADRGHNILVRCALDRQYPEIPSLSPLFAGAIWHEREVFDLFGIRFSNHPDLRRLFLEDNFPGHPLRKDFDDPSRVVRRPY
ncbi:MAG: NADH-quinone oxidoreductase subunit C [Desulfobulbaceae bacterium]|nr:NADH-quinone oxidoreductase subunit C [Desulfobulbaceae bacterium]